MHSHEAMSHSQSGWMDGTVTPFVIALLFYIVLVLFSNRKHKRRWPLYRSLFWTGGILFAAASLVGPIAERSHTDFSFHMVSHLFLGMLAPLLLVLSAPMTLLLRTLPVRHARRLTRILQSMPIRIISHPITAAVLNIGGLWLLYTTNLYGAMQESLLIHLFVHLHVFLAGYLFTASILYIDPIAHHISFLFRAIVLVLASAGHSILSKYIYAFAPNGIPANQAESGGMLMYYGGDAIDLVLIVLFCLQWYRSARPRGVAAEIQ